jgi:hypothetical protein
VLCRDYAINDATQIKFLRNPSSRVLGDSLCVRGDGTKAFFFSLDVMRTLFENGGFEVVELVERVVEPGKGKGNKHDF